MKKILASLFFSVMSLLPSGVKADYDPTYWCHDVIGILEEAKRMSIPQFQRGDFSQASETLVNGLRRALGEDRHSHNGLLTDRALRRGIWLAQAIQQAAEGNANGARTIYYFLGKYFDFVEATIENLDVPYYYPYHRCHSCYPNERLGEFETHYLQYINNQVAVVLDTLAEETRNYYSSYVVPVGSADVFLKALSLSASFAADDLLESPFSARYACSIARLREIHDRIENGTFGDAIDAVNGSYVEARRALEQLEPRCGY